MIGVNGVFKHWGSREGGEHLAFVQCGIAKITIFETEEMPFLGRFYFHVSA